MFIRGSVLKNWFWKGCKPISVCVLANGENHLSQQPVPETCLLSQTRNEPLLGFLFGLAPDGVFRAASLALRAVVSYTTFSPLPTSLAQRRRYILCGTVRRDDSRRRRPRVSQPNEPELRGIAPCGVRTFLPRLASKAILRPSRTTRIISINAAITSSAFDAKRLSTNSPSATSLFVMKTNLVIRRTHDCRSTLRLEE